MELLEASVIQLKTIPSMAIRVARIMELEEAYNSKVPPAPYAYVLLLAETPTKNETITIVEQRVSVALGVVLCINNKVTPLGIKSFAEQSDLQTIRGLIRAKLLGWAPADAGMYYGPFEFGGGRLVQVKNDKLWWQDQYTTECFVRSV
jgi:hypothetical protein